MIFATVLYLWDGLYFSILCATIINMGNLEFLSNQILESFPVQESLSTHIDSNFVKNTGLTRVSMYFPMVLKRSRDLGTQHKTEWELVLPWRYRLPLPIGPQTVTKIVENPILYVRNLDLSTPGFVFFRPAIVRFVAFWLHFSKVHIFLPSEIEVDFGDVGFLVNYKVDKSVDLFPWGVERFL